MSTPIPASAPPDIRAALRALAEALPPNGGSS